MRSSPQVAISAMALAMVVAACTSGSSTGLPARVEPTAGARPSTTDIAAMSGMSVATTTEPAPTSTAATPDSVFQEVLDAEVASTPRIPGELLLVDAPGVDFAGASGYFDRLRDDPLEPDDGFRIASVTKTFTAAAVLRLVEESRIGLDDPIAGHLSNRSTTELVGDGYDPIAITVRHLLTHTSGIYDYAGDNDYQLAVLAQTNKRWTRGEQVRFAVDHGDPMSPPGAEWHYSDTGYVLLGEIVERVTNQPLATAYRTLLRFDRLGLDHTYLESLEATPSGVDPPAHQYAGEIDFAAADPSFDLYGGGGLVSTTADLASFFEALFAGEVFDKPSTLATMLEHPHARDATGTGMGIFRSVIAREECWDNSGFWGAHVVYCPDAALTIVRSINQALPGESYPTRLEIRVAKLALH